MSLLHLLVSLLSLGTMIYFPFLTAVLVAHWDSLVLPAGAVELQTSDATRELWRNKTFIDGNYTLGSRNGTSDWLELEERFEGRTGNQTSDVLAEDDEGFQEQETKFSGQMCQQDKLEEFFHFYCGEQFHYDMMTFDPEDRCVLQDVIRPYNAMTVCLENVSRILNCFYPNPHTQTFFIAMHSEYFRDCKVEAEQEEMEIIDEKIIITLVLVPVILIPILVYLVVRNSQVQE